MIHQPRFRYNPLKGTREEQTSRGGDQGQSHLAPPPGVIDLLLVSSLPTSVPWTLWTSDTHDLCSLRPLSRLLSLPRVRSSGHARSGRLYWATPLVSKLQPSPLCQGTWRPTVPQASPWTSEYTEPECVLAVTPAEEGGPDPRVRRRTFTNATPPGRRESWPGGECWGQRAGDRTCQRRDPHTLPRRSFLPRGRLHARGTRRCSGVPRPAELWVQGAATSGAGRRSRFLARTRDPRGKERSRTVRLHR